LLKSVVVNISALLTALLVVQLGHVAAPAASEVVVIQSYGPDFPTADAVITGLRDALPTSEVVLDIHYLDSKTVWTPAYQAQMAEVLGVRFAARERPFDLVVACDDNALRFVHEHHADLFGGVPVVYLGVNDADAPAELPRDAFVGVLEDIDIAGTVAAAKALQPDLERLWLVADGVRTARADVARARELEAQGELAVAIDVLDLTELSYDALDARVAALPPSEAVLLISAFRDATGLARDFQKGALALSEASAVPIYHLWAHGVGSGLLGGHVVDHRAQGRVAGAMAMRILDGVAPRSIPLVTESPNVWLFDWPTLERFGLDARVLPEGATLLRQPPSLWQQYHREVLAASAIVGGILSLLLGALLLSTRRLQRERVASEASRISAEQDKNEAIGRLAGGVAHDLNNALTVVHATVQRLQRAPTRIAGLEMEVSAIGEASVRAQRLTARLLDVSRSQALTPAKLDVVAVVDGLRPILHSLVDDAVTLVFRLDPATPAVWMDRERMEQAVMQVVANAADALGAREGRVQVSVMPSPSGGALIRVSDTGPGMSATVLARAFDPFFTTRPGATGLGLSTVRGVLEQSGGAVHIHAIEGAGTTVELTVPRWAGQLTTAAEATRVVEAKRILVVDDDPAVRTIVTWSLQDAGFEVLALERPEEVRAALDHRGLSFDLLLTDVRMPEWSGPEVAAHARQVRPGLPVVYLSGFAAPDVVAELTAPPLTWFVAKPFEIDHLVGVLEQAISQVRADGSGPRPRASGAPPLGRADNGSERREVSLDAR
jgi:signal transduction histidine kinase/ActR/RegA family two-component response regulator